MAEITYLMGKDAAGGFYTRAEAYFRSKGTEIVTSPANGQTLEDVFDDLRTRAEAGAGGVFDVINLVSHATQFATLQFGLTKVKRGDTTTAATLHNAVAASTTTAPAPAVLGPPAVTSATHVRLYGCDFGKDAAALKDLGMLFGTPADIAAPLRSAVFRERNGVPQHRLARTWSVAWPTDIEKLPEPSWPAVRTQFVAKATAKFGPIATTRNPGNPQAASKLTADLTRISANATKSSAGVRFFSEGWGVRIPTPKPADMAAFLSQFGPKTGAVISGSEVSDLTVAAELTSADLTDASTPNVRLAHLTVLAEVIDAEVSISDSSQYRTVTIAAPAVPGKPAKPVPDGGAPAPPAGTPAHSLWQSATDAFLAVGGAQEALDALIAGLLDPEPVAALDEPDLHTAVPSGDAVARVRPDAA